jgi:Short C-terminal domain
MYGIADELKKLGELLNEGLLSDEEFQAQKALVLGQTQPLDAVRGHVLMDATAAQPLEGTAPMSPSREQRMTPLRWINIVALAGGFVGLLMAWGTVFIAAVSGLDTSDGKFFGVVLLIAGLLTWWRIMRTNRLNGSLLIVAWLGLLAIGVYEIIHVQISSDMVSVGSGLYVDAAAAVIGTVTALMDTAQRSRATKVIPNHLLTTTSGANVVSGVPPRALTVATLATGQGGHAVSATFSDPIANAVGAGEPNGNLRPSHRRWWVVAGAVLLVVAIQDVVLVEIASKSTAGGGAATTLPFTQLGTGSVSTARFTVNDSSWQIKWSYNCSTYGSQGNFIVSVNGYGTASGDNIYGVNDLGAGSSGVYPVFDKGTFNLQIQSECNWSISVLQH